MAPAYTSTPTSLADYCGISNSKAQYLNATVAIGTSLLEPTGQQFCISTNPTKNGALQVYNINGTPVNAWLQASMPLGPIGRLTARGYGNQTFVAYMLFYYPTGSNETINLNATEFYNSNLYKAFILGKLPGFTQVYPLNETGINYINGTYPIRIYEVDNYTGGLPPVPQKPHWVQNNYSMP